MRIPTPSDVLIVGVSPVSLAFATLLAKGGLNVLVIDKAETPPENSETLKLSHYSVDLLEQHGFKLGDEISTPDFIEQSLSLLAHSLCCVIWRTELVKSVGAQHQLHQNGEVQTHHSNIVFKLHELEISETNLEANIRAVFALAWRVIGVQLKRLHPYVLHSFENEKIAISDFYKEKKELGILDRLVRKFIGTKSTELTLSDSPINLHLSQQGVLKAGQLLPNLTFFDEKLKKEASLYQWCNYQYFSLIVIGSINTHYLFNIAKWVQLNFNVKLLYLPYSENNDSVFTSLGIAPSEKRTVIVRPDLYISMINDTVETDIIDNYLRNVLLMNANAEKVASPN